MARLLFGNDELLHDEQHLPEPSLVLIRVMVVLLDLQQQGPHAAHKLLALEKATQTSTNPPSGLTAAHSRVQLSNGLSRTAGYGLTDRDLLMEVHRLALHAPHVLLPYLQQPPAKRGGRPGLGLRG